MGKHVHLSTHESNNELHVSCQKHKFKHFNFHYIYPISYKIAKRETPDKRICPSSEEEYNHGGLTTLKSIFMRSKSYHAQINHIDIIETKCIVIMLIKLPSDSKLSGHHPDFRLTEF